MTTRPGCPLDRIVRILFGPWTAHLFRDGLTARGRSPLRRVLDAFERAAPSRQDGGTA